jgi:hypothetical protein
MPSKRPVTKRADMTGSVFHLFCAIPRGVLRNGTSQDGGAKGRRFPLNETPSSGRNMKKIEWMPSTPGASIRALPICSNISPGGSAILQWNVDDAGAIFHFSAQNAQ